MPAAECVHVDEFGQLSMPFRVVYHISRLRRSDDGAPLNTAATGGDTSPPALNPATFSGTVLRLATLLRTESSICVQFCVGPSVTGRTSGDSVHRLLRIGHRLAFNSEVRKGKRSTRHTWVRIVWETTNYHRLD